MFYPLFSDAKVELYKRVFLKKSVSLISRAVKRSAKVDARTCSCFIGWMAMSLCYLGQEV
jgi:hypothetical protein